MKFVLIRFIIAASCLSNLFASQAFEANLDASFTALPTKLPCELYEHTLSFLPPQDIFSALTLTKSLYPIAKGVLNRKCAQYFHFDHAYGERTSVFDLLTERGKLATQVKFNESTAAQAEIFTEAVYRHILSTHYVMIPEKLDQNERFETVKKIYQTGVFKTLSSALTENRYVSLEDIFASHKAEIPENHTLVITASDLTHLDDNYVRDNCKNVENWITEKPNVKILLIVDKTILEDNSLSLRVFQIPKNLKYLSLIDLNAKVTELNTHFLACSKSIVSLCLSGFDHLTKIDDDFLFCLENLEHFETYGFKTVEEIGKNFLNDAKKLKIRDLSGFKSLKKIGGHLFAGSDNSERSESCEIIFHKNCKIRTLDVNSFSDHETITLVNFNTEHLDNKSKDIIKFSQNITIK